jgi:hypothetical protein
MADKKNEFIKRRKELAGLSTLTTSVNKNSPLNKLGPSGKFSSALKDMPKDKPSKISDVAKKIFKKSPVGRVIDAGTKIGLGAAAGYEYAKSKFKDKEEKVDKKKLGGMNKSKLKKAAMMGTALLASNYLGKRAGENAVIDSINSGQAFKPEGAKRTPFGVSLNEGGEVEIVKGQDYIKDLL